MGLDESRSNLQHIRMKYTSFTHKSKQRVTYHLLNVTAKKHMLRFTIPSMASLGTEVGEGSRVGKVI